MWLRRPPSPRDKRPKCMLFFWLGCTLLPHVQYHRFVAGDYDHLSGMVV